MVVQSDPKNKTHREYVLNLMERVISYGTEGYEPNIQRRLRFINSVILIFNTLFLVLFLATGVGLALSGETPFTHGNLSLLIFFAVFSVVPFLHRISELAAPTYMMLFGVALNLYFQSRQGTFQSGHIFMLLGVACVPFFLPIQRRLLSVLFVLAFFGGYIYIDYFAPEFGAVIEGRPLFVSQMVKYLNMSMIFLGIYFIVRHSVVVAENAREAVRLERDRSENLLRNILPDPIALRLKNNPNAIIADRHHNAAVVFVDLVGFTPRASRLPAEEVVDLLNRLFSQFDELVEEFGLEKIKTVGDAYMAVAGIPEQLPDNVGAAAEFALAVMEKTRELSRSLGEEIEVRAGIQSGDVIAGVIGTKKFAYDVWGDTVNTAARLEAFGVPNRIQVTDTVKAQLEQRYEFAERGFVEIKGKGPMKTFFLTRKV